MSDIDTNKFSAKFWDSTDSPWLFQLVMETQKIKVHTELREMQLKCLLRGTCIKPSTVLNLPRCVSRHDLF
jgi:hypothetical protein